MRTEHDDRQLVERVLGDDKLAFGALIDRYRAPALAFAARLVGPADAEGVVQDSMLAAFLALRRLRDRDRFRGWLFGIVLNYCKSRLRLRKHGSTIDPFGGLALAGLSLDDLEPSAETVYEAKQLHALVIAAVDTGEQRDSVRMHYLEGLTIGEIALITGSPSGTIKARLHHARNRLRDTLLSELRESFAEPQKECFLWSRSWCMT